MLERQCLHLISRFFDDVRFSSALVDEKRINERLGETEGVAQLASERDSATVGIDDVVRGWIRTTPPEQRNSLVAVIEDLGLEPERYAEELESGEGWEEDEQTE